jgi:hypothetical protein
MVGLLWFAGDDDGGSIDGGAELTLTKISGATEKVPEG